jgi:hypothetical protein
MKTLEKNSNFEISEAPFGFEFDHTFLTNPIVSFCGRFPAKPEDYGFEIWSTGGGCTGHCQKFMLDGKEVLMLITDGNLCHVSDETIQADVSIFDSEMDECFYTWTISR